VADSKRRGEDAEDDRLDAIDDAPEADDLDEQDDDAPAGGRSSRTATRPRPAAAGKKSTVDRKATRSKEGDRPGIFARLLNFFREVVAELRKVIWPTRNELLTYTTVVVIFVAIMLTIVASLDYGFGKLVFAVFAGDVKK
jgi:preprotein translocase subunit SecE